MKVVTLERLVEQLDADNAAAVGSHKPFHRITLTYAVQSRFVSKRLGYRAATSVKAILERGDVENVVAMRTLGDLVLEGNAVVEYRPAPGATYADAELVFKAIATVRHS